MFVQLSALANGICVSVSRVCVSKDLSKTSIRANIGFPLDLAGPDGMHYRVVITCVFTSHRELYI